jgi:hypothetical protein
VQAAIVVENLPVKYNKLMVLEMLKDFPGLGEISGVEDGKTMVTFASIEDAQLAVAGKFHSLHQECTTSNWRTGKDNRAS